MTNITLQGNKFSTVGELPAVGESAKGFELVKNDLGVAKLSDYTGKKVVLNIFPSLDTGTCAASVRRFNKEAASLANTEVLCISRDLPFAQARFCGAEGIDKVVTLSDFNTGQFGKDYQLEIANGPMAGFHSRSIVIVDEAGKVIYTQQVPEIVDEPNYEEALATLK